MENRPELGGKVFLQQPSVWQGWLPLAAGALSNGHHYHDGEDDDHYHDDQDDHDDGDNDCGIDDDDVCTMQKSLGTRGAADSLEKMRSTEDLVTRHLG